ncbi:MAG: sodium-dependent transporter [Methylococcales bacterium]|nr:sodium-dependent transporter [Methylococcales bacterium]
MTEPKKSIHGQWSSRWAFILAATGSAVGLGNIWKFPYITGENGGGAFVLIYLLCVLLIGLPIMMAEALLGRRGRQSPINTMADLADEAGADPKWHYVGWLGVIAGFLILSYYSVIAGWGLAYVLKALLGQFGGRDAAAIETLFADFTSDHLQVGFWHSVFIAMTLWVVAKGVAGGLEKAVRLLMPGLFVLLLLLVGYAMTSGGYQQGLTFLFSPDFSKITGASILTAMGHAFFTLSLGMGAIMVYGSYLPKDISIGRTSLLIAGADTAVALLAGIAIFPIVFANGLQPETGPGLIFQTLPIAFGSMTGGWLFGVLFFVLLVFAAWSSAISLIEPLVAWLVENLRWSRLKACVAAGGTAWLVGLGTVFSFNLGEEVTLFGLNWFELMDYLTANLMLPIGGFCVAVFAGWIMHQQHSQDELALHPPVYYSLWQIAIRYIAPASVFVVFLHVVGVLG